MVNRIFTAAFAAALTLLTACDIIDDDKNSTNALPGNAIVACTDYSTGSLATVDIAEKTSSTGILQGNIDSDIAVRISGGYTYVLNRTSGSVVRLDPANSYSAAVNVSVGASSNPHDLVVSGSTAYVSLFDSASIAMLDAATLVSKGSIDISSYNAAGMSAPQADRMYLDGTNLYVSLQRFADSYFSAIGCSQVLVIDTTTNTVSKTIDLKWDNSGSAVYAKNPCSKFVYASASAWNKGDGHAHLFVLCTGLYSETQSGGVAAIDTTDLAVESGYAAAESAIGAEACDFDYANGRFYIAADGAASSTLYSVTAAGAAVSLKTIASSAWTMPFVRVNGTGLLIVADRSSAAPGVFILDTASDTFTTADAIPTGLPPSDIEIIQ